MYTIRILEMKINDVDDFDENRLVKMHVCKKLALLGLAVCSRRIIVDFVKDERKDARTHCPLG